MSEASDQGFDAVRHFDADKANAYDEYIPRVIPGYHTLHHLTAGILETETGAEGRVLVVGVGTGTEAIEICRAYPGLSVMGLDISTDMLTVARRRIAEAGLEGRIELSEGVVADLPDEAAFDAATLLLVMHFIADDGAKAGILDAIARRLKPGAALVIGDMFGVRGTAAYQDQEAVWRGLQIAAGIDAEDVDKSIRHAEKDTHPIPEERLFDLLEGAGFGTVTPFFLSLMFGGWVARKK
ncbi:MAG: class I SAM-dependent methyltransferase [Rhodospirillales bacterium]|nr:class I SAM-dependent methyltransferase [Rhodospirillales bacterium]